MIWAVIGFLVVCALYVGGAVWLYRYFLPEIREWRRLRRGRGALIVKIADETGVVKKHKIRLEEILDDEG